MIHNMTGGAAGLKLRVLGGTVQPADPAENTIWLNTDTAVTNYAFSVDKPARISSNKNYLVYPYDSGASLTSYGVTYTCNTSGHVTANGTASNSSYYRVYRTPHLWLEPGTYTLSGCPAQPSGGNAYYIYVYSYNTNAAIATDYGSGKTFTLSERTEVSISIGVLNGKTATNAVFKPQLEKAASASSYVKGDATGMVWIKTAAASITPIDIDKKNTVMLYPESAKQYIGGAWVGKSAKLYTNSAWHELWDGYYYKLGEVYEAITGGYATTVSDNTGGSDNARLTLNTDHMVLTARNTGTQGGNMAASLMAVDVTDVNTLVFDCQADRDDTCSVGVTTQKGVWNAAVASASVTNTTRANVSVDVSNVTGQVYILLRAWWNVEAYKGTLTVYNIYKQ